MLTPDERAYREFVALRMESLRRMAFLLCRDWHTADDLVSITIGKLYRHWARVSRAENVDAYVRGVLTHAWLDERRRPWRREDPTAELPEPRRPAASTGGPDLGERQALLDLLAELPPRRRAVLVLRFYCDLSVAETAEILGVTEGTVKSQAARGLETLRLLVTDSLAGQEAR
jgi:RNA polymerase sigma-70 factor (sigma-E family)